MDDFLVVFAAATADGSAVVITLRAALSDFRPRRQR